jgi:hypothetical protein
LGTTCSVVTESGRFRENTRARIEVTFELEELAFIRIHAPGWVQEIALSGEHLAELRREIDQAERAFRRTAAKTRRAAA